MKKRLSLFVCLVMLLSALTLPLSAATTHTVVAGDSMWRIAVKYQVGLSELRSANPHIANPALIYPGQVLTIPTADAAVTDYEQEVIRLVNAERAKKGLSPLTCDWELARVARYKSQDMKQNGYFSHQSPVYGSPFEMMRSFGIRYRTAGENIARGQASPQAVVTAWMNSSGHRANILNASYTHIGVGYVAGGHYWTQMFIGK
jgi:uncharacterized YkwD family protein/spore coat assembly protein SafA